MRQCRSKILPPLAALALFAAVLAVSAFATDHLVVQDRYLYPILPWLALIAMLVNVLSGMTGKFLLERSRRFVAQKKAAYASRGLPEDEVEKRLFWDATAFDLMKKWRVVHLPITLAFAVLGLTHIFSIFLFWQWK